MRLLVALLTALAVGGLVAAGLFGQNRSENRAGGFAAKSGNSPHGERKDVRQLCRHRKLERAGRLFLQPGPAGSLYKATVRYDADAFLPVTEYGDERLRLGLQSKRGFKVRGRQRAGRLDVALGPDAPLSIDLEFGAAQADIELGGLRVRRAEISTGASETTLRFSQPNPERLSALEIEVGAAALRAEGLGNANLERLSVDGGLGDIVLDFSGEWRGNTTADIDMGIGSLTLRVPRGVGLHVVKDGVLAPFDSEGLVKRGSGYYSLDWDSAPHRLTVRIDAAFGSINVRWTEPSVTASRP